MTIQTLKTATRAQSHHSNLTARTTKTGLVNALLLALTFWAAGHTQIANSAELDRKTFGQNPYPLWAPLSYFEKQTISDIHDAKAGDPDALLALYIMASGRYEYDDYQTIQKHIKKFIDQVKEQTDGLLDPWQQGEVLNSTMHQAFFRTPVEQSKTTKEKKENEKRNAGVLTKPPSNYDLDQSKLTGIFVDNTFNCISSSLLYAVLARHLNLKGQGVLLPSHAFIQLDFAEGKTAEVETTSPRGYDQLHDAAFYERSASWFTPRGLTPATYDDYLNRELMPFWQLGTRNMLHQHTHTGRMSDIDRGRLAEISAYLDPNYDHAQNNRLHFYSQEAKQLAELKQWDDLARLTNTVLPQLAKDFYILSEQNHLYNSYFWLHLMAIQAHSQQHNREQTFVYIEEAFKLANDSEQLASAKYQSLNALDTLVKELAKNSYFEAALALTYDLELYAADHPHFASIIAWLYQAWSKHFWEQDDWSQATAILEDYLLQPYLLQDLTSTHKNLSGAYYNWIVSELQAGHAESASAILLQCESLHSLQDTCKKASIELAKYQKTQ